MTARSIQQVLALFDEMGIRLGPEDRRAVNALAGLNPQDLGPVLHLLRRTHRLAATTNHTVGEQA